MDRRIADAAELVLVHVSGEETVVKSPVSHIQNHRFETQFEGARVALVVLSAVVDCIHSH